MVFQLFYLLGVLCRINALPNYTVAVILENGSEYSFDRPKSGPAISLGKPALTSILQGKMNIRFVECLIPNKPITCNIQDVGALMADAYHIDKVDAIIGPGCTLSVEIIGLMAAAWKLPMITPVGSGSSLENKDNYKTLTKLSPGLSDDGVYLVKVLKMFNWTDVSYIRDRSREYSQLQQNSFIPMLTNAGVTTNVIIYNSDYNHEAVLKKASETARVFLITLHPDTLHDLLMEAQRLGMTNGDYAMIVRRQFNNVGRGDQMKPLEMDNHPKFLEAYNSVLLIDRLTLSGPVLEKFVATVTQMSYDEYNYDYGDKPVGENVVQYYNSFLLLGHALNKTLFEGKDPFDGIEVVKNMWNLSFQGLSTMTAIDEEENRDADYGLFDFNSQGQPHIVAEYHGVTKQFTSAAPIHWPGNRGPPPNTPYCGYLGDAPHCQTYEFPGLWIAAIVFSLTLVIICLVGVLIYRKMKLEAELQNHWWKIEWNDVMLQSASRSMSRSRLLIFTYSQFFDTKSKRSQVFAKIAIYKGVTVAVRKLHIHQLNIGRQTLMELKQMRDVNCPNLTKFYGICNEEPRICVLVEYCSRGSLEDILQNDSIQLDKSFKVSLLNDIVEGMTYIHGGPLVCHGRLNSSNCVIDSRFVLKITDYGLRSIRSEVAVDQGQNKERYLLWIAPENLHTLALSSSTQHGDVYSFAIVFFEILTRSSPYEEWDDKKELLAKIRKGGNPPHRPKLDPSTVDSEIMDLLRECWSDDPLLRPSFRQIRQRLKSASWSAPHGNFFDTLLHRMEQYANNLEGLVEERTEAFLEEKRKSEELLYHILPRSVADQLKNGNTVHPEAYDSVTIYFSDIVGFTNLASSSTPMEVVDLLNDLYTCFDDIIDHHNVYKVETIGDAYMVVSGLPVRNGIEHALEIARLSLAILANIGKFKIRHRPGMTLKTRIGIHSGPVCTGVVGKKMPRYCLFGDTVNTASRMESNGEAMMIHVSPTTKTLLDNIGDFQLKRRGDIEIKGKGVMTTYWLMKEMTELQ
ncbi:hypothetical protein ScPMuIL_002769 [Solemya velum]